VSGERDPFRIITWVSLPILLVHLVLMPMIVLAAVSLALLFGLAWAILPPNLSPEQARFVFLFPPLAVVGVLLMIATIYGSVLFGLYSTAAVHMCLRTARLSVRLWVLTLLVLSVSPFLIDWTTVSLRNYVLSVTTLGLGLLVLYCSVLRASAQLATKPPNIA